LVNNLNLFGSKSKVISFLVFLVAIFFYLALLWSYKEKVPNINVNVLTISLLALTILLSAFMVVLGGVIWLLLLRDHDFSVTPTLVIGLFLISQFGKYLPGNIGQYVGRVLLAQRAGIAIPVTLNTMIVEMMWGVASGSGLALLSIYFFIDANDPGIGLIPGKFELFLFVILLLALPWLGIHFVNSYIPNLAKWLTKNDLIPLPKVSTAIIVSTLCFTSFFIMGLILKIQAQFFFGITEGSVFELTCLFAIAWLAGYLAPGAPAGLGVREAMMVLLLSPVLGSGAAVGLGVTLRLTTTVGDSLAFALGVLVRKFAT